MAVLTYTHIANYYQFINIMPYKNNNKIVGDKKMKANPYKINFTGKRMIIQNKLLKR